MKAIKTVWTIADQKTKQKLNFYTSTESDKHQQNFLV